MVSLQIGISKDCLKFLRLEVEGKKDKHRLYLRVRGVKSRRGGCDTTTTLLPFFCVSGSHVTPRGWELHARGLFKNVYIRDIELEVLTSAQSLTHTHTHTSTACCLQT